MSRDARHNVTPEEVVVVPGGKPIIFFTILALVEEGDEVIYPNPGFPIYESMINFLGAKAVPIQLREEMDFRLDVDELAELITDRTKLIILNSPQNPTGGVMTKKDVEDIAARHRRSRHHGADRRDLQPPALRRRAPSIMSLDGMKERIILLDGFSKTYAMTGWRMGYGVMRADLATHIARLMTNSNSCTASFTQIAGIEALRGDQDSVETMYDEFKKRRDVLSTGSTRSKASPAGCPRGVLHVSRTSRRPDGRRRSWRTRCSTRPEWPCCRARPSAPSAKAICASASPTRSRTSRKLWTESTSGRRRICRAVLPLRPCLSF